MADIHLSALTPVQLDYAVAVALNRFHKVEIVCGSDGPICVVSHPRKAKGKAHAPYWFRPSQYWGHGGPLIEEFKVPLNHDVPNVLHSAMVFLLASITGKSVVAIPDTLYALSLQPNEKATHEEN